MDKEKANTGIEYSNGTADYSFHATGIPSNITTKNTSKLKRNLEDYQPGASRSQVFCALDKAAKAKPL